MNILLSDYCTLFHVVKLIRCTLNTLICEVTYFDHLKFIGTTLEVKELSLMKFKSSILLLYVRFAFFILLHFVFLAILSQLAFGIIILQVRL